MELEVAREIIQALADGMDPCTGNELGPGSPIESPDVIHALYAALRVMDKKLRRQRTRGAIAARLVKIGKAPGRESAVVANQRMAAASSGD